MNIPIAALVVFACLCEVAFAQTTNLSRAQREQLGDLVGAVDAVGAAAETDEASLRTHVLRASDGSHYVAFSIAPSPSTPLPSTPVTVYVRLATSRAIASQRPERSLIREWLSGNQAAPPPIVSNRGIAIGE